MIDIANHIEACLKHLTQPPAVKPLRWYTHRSTSLEAMLIQTAIGLGQLDENGCVTKESFTAAGLHLTKELYALTEQQKRTIAEVIYMLWLKRAGIEQRSIAIALKVEGRRVEFYSNGTAHIQGPSYTASWPFSFTPDPDSVLEKISELCAQVIRILLQVSQIFEQLAWKQSPIGSQMAIIKAMYLDDCLEHGVQPQVNRVGEPTTGTSQLSLDLSPNNFDGDAPATAIYRMWLRQVGFLPTDFEIVRPLNNGYSTILKFLPDRKILIQEGTEEIEWPFSISPLPNEDFRPFAVVCEQAIRVFDQVDKIFAGLSWDSPQPTSAVLFEMVEALYILDCLKCRRSPRLAKRV